MPTGDSLAVVSMLFSLAIGAGIAAYSVSGVKARNLWIVTALFSTVTIGWFFLSAKLPFSATQALPLTIALVPVVTISFVAIMLRSRMPAPPVPSAGKAQIKNTDNAPDRLAALISNALYDANEARSAKSNRVAELALPVVQAAMITLNKEAGIPLPNAHGDVRLDLEIGSRLLEKVRPFIKQGHNAEAREAAEAWIKQTIGKKDLPA